MKKIVLILFIVALGASAYVYNSNNGNLGRRTASTYFKVTEGITSQQNDSRDFALGTGARATSTSDFFHDASTGEIYMLGSLYATSSSGDFLADGSIPMTGDLQLGDDNDILLNTAGTYKFGYSTDHTTALLQGDGYISTVGQLRLAANTGAAAGGNWEPAFDMNANGGVQLANTSQGDAADRVFAINMTGGVTIGQNSPLVVDSSTLVVNASGYADKVGIGTTTPSTALDVVGDLTVSGLISGGNFTATGTIAVVMASSSFDTYDLNEVYCNRTSFTEVVKSMQCKVNNGTSVVFGLVNDVDGALDTLTCATTWTYDDGTIANATLESGECLQADFGTNTGSSDVVKFFGYTQVTK